MKFIAFEGWAGCDSGGMRVHALKATTMADAVAEAVKHIDVDETVEMYVIQAADEAVVDVDIERDRIRAERDAVWKASAAANREASDRAEYERLKVKFGG